jgi:hypothetical protein
MDNPWPTGVPQSLWTYNQLRAEELAQVPMMGIKFAPGFLYAFAFGCIFVALFAWKRFSVQSDVTSVSRALTDLNPSDIGGRGALIRAYFIYAGAILLTYVSFTFFGRLILQSTQMIPVVGIQVDLDKLQFDSVQWPLMLAFAFAGLAEMLPPIKVTEGWLRNRAYRAVGIPVRLEQTMRNLIVTLDRACTDTSADDADPLAQRLKVYRDRWAGTLTNHAWSKDHSTQRESSKAEAVSLLAQLELLIFWAKSARGSWPGHEVSSSVRRMERQFVDETVAMLDDIHKRMFEAPQANDDADTAARRHRFSDYLAETIRKAEGLRFDLVGIMAIFLERDLDSPTEGETQTKDEDHAIEPALKQLLIGTERPDTAGTGPEAGMFLALIAVFLFYAAAAWRGVQEPIGQFVETTNVFGVLVTALVETLRIAALTWLPLLAAFSLRQYLWDTGDWARATRTKRRSGYASQVFGCLCLAATVSVIALAGVAALRAFLVAPSSAYFFSLYLNSTGAAFVIFYPTQAIILLVLIPVALLSADLRKSQSMRMWYGVLCALGVGYLSVAHEYHWNTSLKDSCPGLMVISSLDCARRFGLIGHVVLALMAFLAAGVLGELPERTRMIRPRWAPQLGAGCLALALIAMPGALSAQAGPEVAPPQSGAPIEIHVGFRKDAPPFSYAATHLGREGAGSGAEQPFRGFLADLCFDIFAGDPAYRIVPVPVDAENRFLYIRQAGTDPRDVTHLDMVCDATTMRFSDPERAENSIFSPVVFASGVSFLDLISRQNSKEVVLGFIGNSTAREVARKSCEIDYFKALLPSERGSLYQRCKLRWTAAMAAAEIRRAMDGSPLKEGDNNYKAKWLVDGPSDDGHSAEIRRARLAWNEVRDAGERLKLVVDSDRLERLNGDTLWLMEGALSWPADAPAAPYTDCAWDNIDACGKTVEMLDDRFCPGSTARTRSAGLGQGGARSIEQRPWPDYHFCPMRSHDELIEWFCTAPRGERRIYIGDRELILGKLDAWSKTHGPCTIDSAQAAAYLSYEPYAFPISMADPQLVQFVQRRIYELFSNRVEMISRFEASFPGHEMSPALAYLFLLNGVENEETLAPRQGLPTSAIRPASLP